VNDLVIGRRFFTDGPKRDVYRAPDGGLDVVDDWGIPIFGVCVQADMAEGNGSVGRPRCPAR
jgi:hypothetical protein